MSTIFLGWSAAKLKDEQRQKSKANGIQCGMNSRRLIGNVESVDIPLRETRTRIWPDVPQIITKLSVSERGVHAASLSLLPHLSLNSNLVGSFKLKRPDPHRAEAALFRLRLR